MFDSSIEETIPDSLSPAGGEIPESQSQSELKAATRRFEHARYRHTSEVMERTPWGNP